jgi:hypothetical protein
MTLYELAPGQGMAVSGYGGADAKIVSPTQPGLKPWRRRSG